MNWTKSRPTTTTYQLLSNKLYDNLESQTTIPFVSKSIENDKYNFIQVDLTRIRSWFFCE